MKTAAESVGNQRIAIRASAVHRALREAITTMLAVLATLACTLAIDPELGPALLAVVLSVSLSRSQLDRDPRGRLEAAAALPLVSLTATGVGFLLLHMPWVGAGVFVTGMTVSIWLRRFGPMARRVGSLIALPFVAILATPYVPTRQVGHLMMMLLPVIVALLALGWVMLFHALARRLRLLPTASSLNIGVTAVPRAITATATTMRPMASTRMAIQMAVALGASFLVGYVLFPEHWAWIVLTAFIVNSGNRGRLDVAYKSVLRVVGAAFGTLLALALTSSVGTQSGATVEWMLAALFLGIWLRPLGYAWWALFVTVALALLQGYEGTSAPLMLWPRLQEIMIGAVIGVACAWLVYPVRSTTVLRRRLADALLAFAEAFDPATSMRRADAISLAMQRIEQIAPAFRASRLATSRFHHLQPADWVDMLAACHAPALALIAQGQTPGIVRRAIGAAGKTLREPNELLAALQHLHRSLFEATQTEANPPSSPSTRPI